MRSSNIPIRHDDCSSAAVALRINSLASSSANDLAETTAPEDGDVLESGTFERTTPTTRLARVLRARIVHFRDDARARERSSPFEIPDELLILPDGAVIASYEGEPLLRYRSLGHLLEQHDLAEADLEA